MNTSKEIVTVHLEHDEAARLQQEVDAIKRAMGLSLRDMASSYPTITNLAQKLHSETRPD